MSAKKDMRRADLVIPYVEPKDEKPTDFSSTITSTMPMAADQVFSINSTVELVGRDTGPETES
ncbi:hypothetical protein Z517_09126 [Fonsecaea pedrosoi CBS 271.37]|uniref:Uncharacterized protein n=1 Tax=Fonsecaea pedrosoi CBS 271.37 TaxID=1442368 RepID=A0A0D2EQX2_9EURO|nr:uncharacterized protein Z517_09126 [Fonsecaea pedrosoi CBS 271.37]KIW76682.1 hypothetical protein Z517_09126 [Fonsecaea pedrosoi CBS 271.37]